MRDASADDQSVDAVQTPCDELTWLEKVGAAYKQLTDNLEARAAELSKEQRMMQLASAKLGKGKRAAAYKLLSFLSASRLASAQSTLAGAGQKLRSAAQLMQRRTGNLQGMLRATKIKTATYTGATPAVGTDVYFPTSTAKCTIKAVLADKPATACKSTEGSEAKLNLAAAHLPKIPKVKGVKTVDFNFPDIKVAIETKGTPASGHNSDAKKETCADNAEAKASADNGIGIAAINKVTGMLTPAETTLLEGGSNCKAHTDDTDHYIVTLGQIATEVCNTRNIIITQPTKLEDETVYNLAQDGTVQTVALLLLGKKLEKTLQDAAEKAVAEELLEGKGAKVKDKVFTELSKKDLKITSGSITIETSITEAAANNDYETEMAYFDGENADEKQVGKTEASTTKDQPTKKTNPEDKSGDKKDGDTLKTLCSSF
uniref:Variant surface glycoprotein 1125.4909 n=1 Tax=Trypanosoma brucei TaxID=5691 RepID=A0A1J0RAZ9_9TRYP|nr:variant surface glycoprotein 1125.4909 [Trypanosoma brucei]